MIVIYEKMVKDLQHASGISLPYERRQLMQIIKEQKFDEFSKDHYSEKERAACSALFRESLKLINDPYLLFELHKIQKVYERKYKYNRSK
jgi:hypothetical protein